MNPDSPEFAEQLRQATSRHDPATSLDPATPLDPELAALRSGFLALGRALEAAADDVDEKRLVAGSMETRALDIAIVRKNARASTDEQRTMIWLAATAAVLLLSVGIVAYATRGTAMPDQVAQPKVAPEATKPEVEPSVPESQVDMPQLANDDPTRSNDDDLLEWNDALDESFAAAERHVGQAGWLSGAAEARVETLHKQIQAASEDMQSGSL